MSNHFYNEWDRYAAEWLRNLQAAGRIPAGLVDERSIEDVQAEDVAGRQAHFFAGIGGWPLALRLAGWRESWPVWTGSCPCQPFSSAGKAGGMGDERHLWPAFHRLIAERRPPVVFGEQVASEDGRYWLSGVRTDLEDLGYAVGAADLCAASVGAPHIRQRLFWVADAQDPDWRAGIGREEEATGQNELGGGRYSGGGSDGRLDDAASERAQQPAEAIQGRNGAHNGLPLPASHDGRMGDSRGEGRERDEHETIRGARRGQEGRAASKPGAAPGHWDAYDLIPCGDGKSRRLEPGTFPLAHGVPCRVGKLRAYGNAIVPQAAAHFVRAYMEARGIVKDVSADSGRKV